MRRDIKTLGLAVYVTTQWVMLLYTVYIGIAATKQILDRWAP